jgi:hypothetical protein
MEDSDQKLLLVCITLLLDNLPVLKCSFMENKIELSSARELEMPPKTNSSTRVIGFEKEMAGQCLSLSELKRIFAAVRHSQNLLEIGFALTKCQEESKRWSHLPPTKHRRSVSKLVLAWQRWVNIGSMMSKKLLRCPG